MAIIETYTQDKYGNSRKQIGVNEREHPTPELRFAMALIERWGLIAAKENGEDSAGRQRLTMMAPEEVVERAFVTARLAFRHAREREMFTLLPSVLEEEGDEK